MKMLCKTFADRASQLRFVTTFQLTHPTPQPQEESAYDLLKIAEPPVFLAAASLQVAIKLKEYLTTQEALSPDIVRCLSNGILLGKPSYRQLTPQELSDIKYWLRDIDFDHELPNVCQTYARVVKSTDYDMAMVYRAGEYVIVRDAQTEEVEWLVRLTDIVVYGPVAKQFHYYLNGTYFAAKNHRGAIDYDTWTGQPKMVKRDYARLCLTPLHLIDRKVMTHPIDRSSWLTVEIDEPVVCRTVHIPYYPHPGEVVRVNKRGPSYILVTDVVGQVVRGHELRPVKATVLRWNTCRTTTKIELSSIVSCIPHHMQGVYICTFKLFQ